MDDILDPFKTTHELPSITIPEGGIVDPFKQTAATKTSTLAPEPADHGLSERQKLSPVGKALSPITSYWPNVKRFEQEGLTQASEGLHQMTHPDSLIDPKAHGISDVLSGAANTAIGAAGFAASPISAAYRSIVGQPIEDVTGIPREYPEFAAQLATPGIGLRTLTSKPKPVPPIPRPTPTTDPFGVALTEGERTGDLAARQAEQAAIRGQAGKPAQEHAEEFLHVARPEQLEQAKTDVVKSLDTGNQELAQNPAQAAELVQQSLQTEAARSKANVKSLYDQAKALPGEIHADTFSDMPQDIKTSLSNRPDSVIIDDNTPIATRMINYLDKQIGELKIKNLAQPQSTALASQGPAPIVGVNLEGVEQWRKNLSRMRGDAIAAYRTNPSDTRAANAIINEFDQRITDAVNSGAFRGDPRAVDLFNQARAAHSERMKIWGNDPIGRKLQAIIGDAASGRDPASLNDVANYMYSASGTSPNSVNVGVAKRIKKVLGEDSPEWAAIRQGLLHRLISTAENVADRGAGTIANRIGEFINGKGSDLAKEVFTKPQRDLLNQYAELHRKLSVPQVAANWPNTAAGIIPHIRAVTDKVLGAVGAYIGHHILPVAGGFAGWAAGTQVSSALNAAENARNLHQVAQQMPLLSQQMKVWQEATKAAQRANTVANQSRKTIAATNVTAALGKLGIDQAAALKLLRVEGPGTSNAGENAPGHAKGGKVQPVPESKETLKAQQKQLLDGSRHAQLFPGGKGELSLPKGHYRAKMPNGDVFHYHPKHMTTQRLLKASKDGRENDVLGLGPFNKIEAMSRAQAGEHPVAVVERDSKGTEVRAAAGTHATVPAQVASLHSTKSSGHSVSVEHPDHTIALRGRAEGGSIDATSEEAPPIPKRLYMNMSQEGTTKTDLPEIPDTRPSSVKGLAETPFSEGTKVGNRLTGLGGEERYQTWPERMLRSGTTLAGDVMSGEQPMLPPGLRREDFTDKPKPSGLEVAAQPNDPAYERVQDMAGLAGSGGLGGVGEEAGAALGSSPFLRPALKYNNKIYKAPEGGQHLDAIPAELQDTFHRQALSGEDISNFNFGFMNHKGQFLDREKAMDYAVKEGLIDPHAANQGALTSTILEDSATPGAALSALEHEAQGRTTFAEPPKAPEMQVAQEAPTGNLPTKYQPEALESDVQKFLKLAQTYQGKLGEDWISKLTPDQLQSLKATPTFAKSLANIEAAKNAGVFNKILEAPINRRSLFAGTGVLASAITNASKISKLLETVAPSVPVGPSVAEQALSKIGGLKDTFKSRSDELMSNYYRAERKITDARDAEMREAYRNDELRNGPSDRTLYGVEKRINDKYKPELDRLKGEMIKEHHALRNEADSVLAKQRQDLSLPKLNPEQQRVLDYVVDRGQRFHNEDFTDAKITQSPYELKADRESITDTNYLAFLDKRYQAAKESGKFEDIDIGYLLRRMSPEEKAQIAEHIKPALLQDSNLRLEDARTIAKAFPSLKGFALFAENRASAPLAALEHAQPFYSAVEKTIPLFSDTSANAPLSALEKGSSSESFRKWRSNLSDKSIKDIGIRAYQSKFENPYTTDAYHGTPHEFEKPEINVMEERSYHRPFYSTADPKLAEDYAVSKHSHGQSGPNILPLKLDTRNFHVVNGEGKYWTEVNSKAIRAAKESGKNGVTIHNVVDPAEHYKVPSTIHIAFDPSVIRSKFAKFEPHNHGKSGLFLTDTILHGAPLSQSEHPENNKQNIEWPVEKAKTEPKINAPVERAAGGRVLLSNINHTPTEAQKAAGNYSKDHINIHGLNITIENAKGKERSGIGNDGRKWSVKMPAHYGYLKNTKGADGDHVDAYIGPHTKCDKVFVINQIDADTKEFDEVKTMLCFGSLQQAINTYDKGFSDGKGLQRIGSIVATDIPHFKKWISDANTKKPFVEPK